MQNDTVLTHTYTHTYKQTNNEVTLTLYSPAILYLSNYLREIKTFVTNTHTPHVHQTKQNKQHPGHEYL